jgi:signal transduction histidine kinase
MESVIDISDRKRAESELLKRIKSESAGIISGGIAEDFSHLLTVINENLDKINSAPDGKLTKADRGYLKTAEKVSKQAAGLVKQFLTISKGDWSLKTPVSLADIFAANRTDLTPLERIPYSLNLPENLHLIYGTKNQLRQVMEHLVQNSHEAAQNEDEITDIRISAQNVTIAQDKKQCNSKDQQQNSARPTSTDYESENHKTPEPGEYVKISVKDNGKGIPSQLLEKIFDPYFSTKKKGSKKGLGMGLPLCYAITRKHNGHIGIRPNFPAGTIVEILLPAYTGQDREVQ